MKPRTLIIGVSLSICGLTITGVVLQARQLDALREEGQRLRQKLKHLRDEEARTVSSAAVTKQAVSPPSLELLRLRNQVSQLLRRQRELANVQTENERLRTRIATARTNAANGLPLGYIRKSEARNMGYTSPEATLQTLLWAIQNRDFTNLVASFTAESAREMQEQMKRSGNSVAEFFKDAEFLPGFNVLNRVATGDDALELKVEIVPGNGAYAQPMRFRLINGEWKMESH